MALGLKKEKHTVAFMSKLLAGFGGAHQFNMTLASDRDNGELVLRGEWNSFDNYDEKSGKITFEGVIRAENTTEGGYYIEVVKPGDALIIYNTPKNPYTGTDLDEPELFYNEKGDTVVGKQLVVGDIFSISDEGFKGTPEVGKTVTFADHKYVVAAGTGA